MNTSIKNALFSSMVGFSVLLVALLVLFTGCGEEDKSAKSLTIKILSTDEKIQDDAFSPIVQQFASAHPRLTVNCLPETVSSDISSNELTALLTDCDVAVFPSVLNEKLNSQANLLFYPIQKMEIALPPVLDTAYAGSTESSFWAVPLLLDPMMMFVKKSGLDDTYVPRDWQTILMRASMLEKPQPYFVFLSGSPLGLADGIALQQYSSGFMTEILHHTPFEEGVTELDKLGDCARSLANMKNCMIGTVEDRLVGIPQAKNLESFIESDAYATFARYSEYAQLSESNRDRLFEITIPVSYGPVSIGYVIAAGIPVQSKNPMVGEEFVRWLVGQVEQIAPKQFYLSAQLPTDQEKGVGIFSRNTVFVPRIGNGALSEKIIIDAINGDLGIAELNRLWGSSFFVPSGNL